MNKLIVYLQDVSGKHKKFIGNKALALAKIIREDINVPPGFCLTRSAYDLFVKHTGIDKKILIELGRKSMADMRWEELWDASLRIRNMFTNADMPPNLRKKITDSVKNFFGSKPVAVRSSSLAEDSADASFAGLHESFINICEMEKIIQCVKLVWASLWSDAALLYRKELSLNVKTSAMSVIIQQMVCGDTSGVAFCVNPNDKDQSVIESVYGLNKGLVDGDVEPDRFFIDRKTASVVSVQEASNHYKLKPVLNGARITECDEQELSLNNQQISSIYDVMQKLELFFGEPQDIEWTIKENIIYLLQSRPITTEKKGQRAWYLSLRRSLNNLKKLSERIEYEILPGMQNDADKMSLNDLSKLSSDELIEEIKNRQLIYNNWKNIYWDECIPFAHGVRLFGMVYNDMINPSDPYEFIDIILPETMLSLERNHNMQELSDYLSKNPDCYDSKGFIKDVYVKQKLSQISQDLNIFMATSEESEANNQFIINFIAKLSIKKSSSNQAKTSQRLKKTNAFIAAFSNEDKPYAEELISIARKSYQFRDDDNIYLSKIETHLSFALKEAEKRLSQRYNTQVTNMNPEEIITALKFPDYCIPKKKKKTIKMERKIINARQLRGQPAVKGIAKGVARVIYSYNDVLSVQKNEIIVCDAIDPKMTFCIPLVSAIVERRGGMLIHGSIIAREYGIPCVTGIPKATEFIQTGDQITVDGFYGLVINHTRTL